MQETIKDDETGRIYTIHRMAKKISVIDVKYKEDFDYFLYFYSWLSFL